MANAAITVDLNAKIAQFETELKKATGSLDRFEKKGAQVGAGLKAAFGGFAAALSVGAIAAFAKSGIDAADALNDMSQRLGVSVKDLASFQLAAEQSGTSLDGVGAGIARLTRSIGEAEGGNKKLSSALVELGITARDPKEAFFQLADAVETIEDPSKRAALLSQVLGKSYQDLVPLLAQGGDELRKSADASESFADAMARLAPDADKFNDQLATLKQNAATAAASGLIPLVEALNRVFERYEKIARLSASGASIVEILTGGINANTASGLKNVNSDISGIEATLTRLRKNSGGKDQSIIPLEAELARLKTLRAELQKLEAERIMAPPGGKTKARGSVVVDNSAQLDCIANGGTWNGKSCTPKKTSGGSKSDPQGAFVAKLRDEAATLGLTGEALQRYEAIKLKLTGSNAKLADSYITQIAAFKEQQDAAKANNEAFDEAIKKQDELDASLENSIKSVREWIVEQEFEVSLIGLSNSERETAIQMRALETAGIDTQTEAYKKLTEQVAAANADKRGISLLSGTQTEKTKEFLADVDALNKLFFDGKIGAQQFAEGIDLITGSTEKSKKEMDTFAETAAKNIQNSMADFLFDPFDKGLNGMLQGFGQMLQKMIAEAAAADLAKKLFGGLSDGGKTGGSGLVGAGLDWLGGLMSFDGGGSTGSGSRTGGIDGKGGFLSVLHPKETVVDHTKGQRAGGSTTIVVNVSGSNNAPDVRRAAGQGAREALGMINGAKRYA